MSLLKIAVEKLPPSQRLSLEMALETQSLQEKKLFICDLEQ